MAFNIWPALLDGTVEQNNYNEGLANNLLSSNFDIGPPQTRRRSTGAPVPISMSILITSEQVATFKTFYKDTLISGSQMFEWVQPISGTPVAMQFITDAQPSIRPVGGDYYRIAMQLNMFEDIPV